MLHPTAIVHLLSQASKLTILFGFVIHKNYNREQINIEEAKIGNLLALEST